jgi:hypothetical protein
MPNDKCILGQLLVKTSGGCAVNEEVQRIRSGAERQERK